MTPTATYQLIEHRLGTSLPRYVAKRRKAGKGWRPIAEEISAETGVKVSYEAVRSWFANPDTEAVA